MSINEESSATPIVAEAAPGAVVWDLILMAAWLGLAAGWVEVGTRVFLKNALGAGHMYLMMRHFIWSVPLANLLMFLSAGLIFATASRRWSRLGLWIGRRTLLALALLPPMLVAGRQVYSWAWLLLAGGIAMRSIPALARIIQPGSNK